jgi:hypothetical protein
MAQDFIFKVLNAAEMIDNLTRQYVHHERTDREIAPFRRLVRSDERIAEGLKIAVTRTDRAFLSRQSA